MPAGNVVLCIDDEPNALALRKLVLQSAGFAVFCASSGEEGLELFDRQPVDAVVVDYFMPGMDRAAVAAALKQRSPRLPVIMLTGHPEIREYVANSIDAFLTKGESPQALVESVHSLIKLRNHSHPELQHPYVVFVDSNRRYLDCSDAVCELLGQRRMDLMGLTIDDISYDPELVSPLFESFRKQRGQTGKYILKHKSGALVPIRYRAHVFNDGCLAACWEPI
jgi:CheY-like chemotaxis protein